MTLDQIIDEVLRREGGFVQHAADRGGATNHGITQAVLADYRGRPVTVDDVRALDAAEAREIYYRRYVERPGFERIADQQLRRLLVDCGVHHGPAQAIRWLQRACGVEADGIIGPITARAANELSARMLRARVVAARARLFGTLVSADPQLRAARHAGINLQAEFAAGWNNRLAEFIEDLA